MFSYEAKIQFTPIALKNSITWKDLLFYHSRSYEGHGFSNTRTMKLEVHRENDVNGKILRDVRRLHNCILSRTKHASLNKVQKSRHPLI